MIFHYETQVKFKKIGRTEKVSMATYLIRARVGHIDDASCLFGLQVGDEATFQGLGLTKDVFLVSTTG